MVWNFLVTLNAIVETQLEPEIFVSDEDMLLFYDRDTRKVLLSELRKSSIVIAVLGKEVEEGDFDPGILELEVSVPEKIFRREVGYYKKL